jgi:class 3 adenylate cyclase
MFTDLEGFSRGVAEFGIVHFLQLIHESQRVFVPCIEEHDGYLLKVEADSMLVIFHTVEKAVNCSIAMQRECKAYNQDKPDTGKLLLGVGLGYGKVLRIGDHDVFGAEVNAASKLGEDTAEAWEILITDSVQAAVEKCCEWKFDPIDYVPPGAKKFDPIDYVPPGAKSAARLKYKL